MGLNLKNWKLFFVPSEKDKKREGPEYPLGDNNAEIVSQSGKNLDEINMESVISGKVTIDDFRISSKTLKLQAEFSRKAGRKNLALNLERAAEMVGLEQSELLKTYELLRPGRATCKQELLDLASFWKKMKNANKVAELIEEAAEAYEKKGLFKKRY